jgi:hypothetical protein
MSPFYIAVFLLALACVPSLLMWLMFSFLGFSLAKGTAEQALAPLVLVAGWWGWASLVGASHATLNDLPWRMWVRLGLPEPVPPTEHGYKYRAVYVVNGERVVGFDNERGKGDHCHLDGTELPYAFTGVDQLIEDFIAAVAARREP